MFVLGRFGGRYGCGSIRRNWKVSHWARCSWHMSEEQLANILECKVSVLTSLRCLRDVCHPRVSLDDQVHGHSRKSTAKKEP
jgi:hypothetical protein